MANRFWIHKDGRLTADTEVPKGLIVTGYSAPYYYSQVFDANGLFQKLSPAPKTSERGRDGP